MRNRPDRLRYESYGVYVLTDGNGTLQPMYRVQNADLSGDFTTEQLLELANEGFVQIKQNTPSFTISLGTNQTAQDIVSSSVNALQQMALLSNGDSIGTGRQEVFAIGETMKYHSMGGLTLTGTEVHPNGGADTALFQMPGGDTVVEYDVTSAGAADAIAFQFTTPNQDQKMAVRAVSFYLTKVGSPAGTMQAKIYEDTGGLPEVAGANNELAVSNTLTINTAVASATPTLQWVEFTFSDVVYLDKNTVYHISLEPSGYTYASGVTELNVGVVTVTATRGNQELWNGAAWAELNTSAVMFSIDGVWEQDDYDYYLHTSQIANHTVSTEDGYNAIQSSVDVFLPVKGQEELQRVQLFTHAVVSSMSWAFEVGGVATWEATLETDNETIFTDARKIVDGLAVEATSTDEGNDYIDLSATSVTFSDVWVVELNGETLIEAASVATVGDVGRCSGDSLKKWFFDTGTDRLYFTTGLLKALDAVHIYGDPDTDPTWASYELVSEPGDQGGLYKGELNIKMIVDTTRPRVVEGLAVADSTSAAIVSIEQGTCYLKNPNTDELELWRLEETTYYKLYNLGTATTQTILTLVMDNESMYIEEIQGGTAGTEIDDGTLSDYHLILAEIVTTGGPPATDITSVTDRRECLVNRLSLIQSASISADLSREVVMELGNHRDVERSLNKPVPVTADVTAKDTDEELYVLLHEVSTADLVTTSVADQSAISYTDTTLTDTDNFTTTPSPGDIVVVRGVKGLVKSSTASVCTVYGWYGETPLDGVGYSIYKGILNSDRMSESLGIQVNLFTSEDREETDKNIIIETINARPVSQSLSVSVGGDGELSFSLNSDNVRALVVA